MVVGHKFKGIIRREEMCDGKYSVPVLDIYMDDEFVFSIRMGEVNMIYKDFKPHVTVELRFDELEVKDSEDDK